MSEVTCILDEIDAGDPQAADRLLPLVYDELRRLAAHKMAHEKPGQTLDATALVHEAYLRLVGSGDRPKWDGRGHFFAAAAEAMRRILVEQARRKQCLKRGGGKAHEDVYESPLAAPEPDEDLLALDEALGRLAEQDGAKADLVKLRYFAGMTTPEAARALGISTATAERYWAYAKAWLHYEIRRGDEGPEG